MFFGRANSFFSSVSRAYTSLTPVQRNLLLTTCVATIGYCALHTTAYAESKPVLTYFDSRGRAEFSRLLFAEAGADYVDNRVNSEGFKAIKSELPFGQLPVLEADGQMFAQSISIARYIARKYGLYPTSVEEAAKADMVVDGVIDANTALNTANKDASKKTQFWDESLPSWADHMEKILKKNQDANKSDFFVGKEITYADLAVFNFVDGLLRTKSDAFEKYPLLKTHYEKIKSRPKIAKWLSTRPETRF